METISTNTKTSSNDSNIDFPLLSFEPVKELSYKNEDLVNAVVKLPSGDYWRLEESGKGFMYIKLIKNPKAAPVKINIGQVLTEVNSGRWPIFLDGDNSWKQYLFTEEEFKHKERVLKCIIYQQLCLEANDDLIDTLDHDNYLKNLLLKTNKGLERKTKQSLQGVYGADPQMLTNVFNAIDTFVAALANKLPHEYFYMNTIIQEYDADPKRFINRQILLNKVE